MIRTTGVLLGALLLPVGALAGQVTLNLDAGTLRDSGGTPMPDSGLLILAVSTTDGNNFTAPTPGAFFSGDDYELFRWDLTAANGNTSDTSLFPGFFSGTTGPLTLENVPSWTAGDPLRIYWFPTKTIGDSSPGAGTQYGTYPVDGSWTTPGAGGTANLQLFTQSVGGSEPNSTGNASLTVVPEPSTYAAAFGMACLGFGLWRRKFAQKS